MDRNISPYLEKTEWAARKRKGLSGKLLDLRRLASCIAPWDWGDRAYVAETMRDATRQRTSRRGNNRTVG